MNSNDEDDIKKKKRKDENKDEDDFSFPFDMWGSSGDFNIDEIMEKFLPYFKGSSFGKIMDEIMKNLMKNIEKGMDSGSFEDLFKNPYVFGFNVGVGPDGKPTFGKFGNIKPTAYGDIETTDVREPLIDVFQEGDKIRVIATTKFLEKYPDKSIPILEDGLFVTGPLAIILTFFEVNNFPAIGILPYAESSRVDPLAASQAINKINELTSLNINPNKSIQDAELIEQNLEEVITQTKDQQIDEKEQGSRRLYI